MKGGKAYRYWSSRDWSKPDHVIAKDMARSIQSVKNWRRALGKPNVEDPNKTKAKQQELSSWQALDWSKPNVQLCRETGKSYSTVINWRNRLGKPKITLLASRNLEIQTRAKSGESYIAIARNFGITRARVEQIVNFEKSAARIDSRGLAPILNCCQFCGALGKVSQHHPNYAHPRLVTWLCNGCHPVGDAHRREREQKEAA